MQRGPPLRTLKTELPPPEVIQDLRIVCHDVLPSVPTEELLHSSACKYAVQKSVRKWSGVGVLKSYLQWRYQMSNHTSEDDRLSNNEPNGSIPMELPLVLRVEDLMQILSIGRNTAYELVRSGKIKSIRIGRSYRITRDSIAEYLAQNQDST